MLGWLYLVFSELDNYSVLLMFGFLVLKSVLNAVTSLLPSFPIFSVIITTSCFSYLNSKLGCYVSTELAAKGIECPTAIVQL